MYSFPPTVLYLLPRNHRIFPWKILFLREAGKGLLGKKVRGWGN